MRPTTGAQSALLVPSRPVGGLQEGARQGRGTHAGRWNSNGQRTTWGLPVSGLWNALEQRPVIGRTQAYPVRGTMVPYAKRFRKHVLCTVSYIARERCGKMRGLVHILLIIAVIAIIWHFLKGRNTEWAGRSSSVAFHHFRAAAPCISLNLLHYMPRIPFVQMTIVAQL
jgi:hypothetical protein